MSKEMIISPSLHETKLALMEEGQVVEILVEREKEAGLVGSIYKGRVTRVLPGMQSAFVDIGLDRDAFLYVSDFFEGLEEYEQLAVPDGEELVQESRSSPPAAGAEVPAEGAAQPIQEERQPDFPSAEPPLALPERRPRARSPRGRGRPRRRGARGRRPRRSVPSERGHKPEEDFSPLSPPVILPGESLAKYRDLGVQAPESKPADTAGQPPEGSSGEVSNALVATEERVQPAGLPSTEPAAPATLDSPSEEAKQVEPASLAEEPAASPEAQPDSLALSPRPETTPEEVSVEPEAASVVEEQGPGSALEPESPVPSLNAQTAFEEERIVAEPTATPKRPEPAVGPQPEVGAAPLNAEAPRGEAERNHQAAEGYPDAMMLAEIQRVREYKDQVGLPPSVQERTAGGVEWQKRRATGPRRTGLGRRRRGRRPSPRRMPARRQRRRTPARPTRGQPAIAELLRPGQEIIVQIAKEQMGKKGARITSHVTLPGRLLVYMPTIDHIGISRRIGTSEERTRLRRLLLELKATISGGFVVRTAATGCSEEDLRQDIDYLVKLWHDIRVRAEESPAPVLLHRDLSLVERILRDQLTDDYENIWIDNEEEYAKVLEFVGRLQPAFTRRIKLYTKSTPIFEEMGVQQEIDRAMRPKVWLKSGGYIVINHTEALVAIDVNTGKFVGKGSSRLEDTIVKTNLEALQEIVRQIRLRDLGGIIIIDFIDMEDSRNRTKVMRALEGALRNDRSPSKLLSFNEFGLVAITRKRSRQSLERVLCQPCPTCTGTGMVKSIETLSYEIQGEASKMAREMDAPELTIRAHPDIVQSLKGRQHGLVRELEEQTGKNIILQSDKALHFEEYNIY